MGRSLPQRCPASSLFDILLAMQHLRNDADLAHSLETEPCNISRLRAGRRQVGPALILRMHDVFDMPLADIKAALEMKYLPRFGAV